MPKRWDSGERKLVYESRPWLAVYEQEVRLPNGHVIPKYLVSEVPDVAMVFAVTGEERVVLVQQYKHGVGEVIWDLPAGYIDPDEAPASAAIRELEEETGYVSDRWEDMGGFFFDENRHNHRFHFFLAHDARAEGRQAFDDTEDIHVDTVPLTEVAQCITDKRIQGMHSAYGILLGLRLLGK